ncbi:MAG: polysaccharide biosynthesis protein, partial [Thiotrichales bacterium]|nr:polysaccharide biosynthesis protein [Thiotrichales bacterium]
MSKLIFSRLRFLAFGHDVMMVPLAWIAAYWFRFNLTAIPDSYMGGMLTYLPVVIAIQVTMFWYFGLYRGVWRFASLPDLVRIAKAVLLGAGFIAIVLFLWTRMVGIPRSVLPLYGIFLVILIGGSRFLYRWFKDHKFKVIRGKSALIIGAGRAGEILARDLMQDQSKEYTPVAFLDDSLSKRGKEIHGIRVMGSVDELPQAIADIAAEVVLLAIPSASSAQMRRIVDHCEEAGVPFRTLPKYTDLVSGRVSVQSLREVAIDDLLGREQVKLDWSRISQEISGNTVMVSGAGGSIGSELCRQIARLSPEKLLLVDHSEFALYSVEKELRESFPNLSLNFYLVSVTDQIAMDHIFSKELPAIVFHAAAYKHVPLLQGQSRVAVKNNVLGTYTLAKSAVKYNCRKFVMVSTDKAVNPSNIMGATKRMAEMTCQTLSAGSKTRFIT